MSAHECIEIISDSVEIASDYAEFRKSFMIPQQAYVDEITKSTYNQLRISQGKFLTRVFKHREVYLLGIINDNSATYMSSLLLALDKKSQDTITIFIDSPGGSVTAGLGLYDTMQFISSPVKTVCTGIAASMAAVIFSSGTHGQRYLSSASRLMIHAPIKSEPGTKADLNPDMRQFGKELYNILSKNAGKPYEEIKRDCEKEIWLTAEEAVKYGLADKVIK